jgi:hypothetical protein
MSPPNRHGYVDARIILSDCAVPAAEASVADAAVTPVAPVALAAVAVTALTPTDAVTRVVARIICSINRTTAEVFPSAAEHDPRGP